MLKKVIIGAVVVVLLIVGVLWGKPIYARVAKLVGGTPKIVVGASTEFTVNLIDPGMKRYLRVRMTFAYFPNKSLVKELGEREAEVRDSIIGVLRSKTVADLTADSTEKLRAELISAINGVLTAGEIQDLYFIEFVIQ